MTKHVPHGRRIGCLDLDLSPAPIWDASDAFPKSDDAGKYYVSFETRDRTYSKGSRGGENVRHRYDFSQRERNGRRK